MAYAVYFQASGRFLICETEDGGIDRVLYETIGHAGRGEGRNNPEAQDVKNWGPLPAGDYRVARSEHPRFRAPAFRLTPKPDTVMYGRSGFWIHGDSMTNPGSASRGCIVISHAAREWVEHYRVRDLTVLSGPAQPGT